jgi:formylglycine-generating enzyme required for sulfatase activity
LNRSDIGFFAPHELVARPVEISRSFYAGKYLVTVRQFSRFVQSAEYVTDAESGSRPWRGLAKGAYTVAGTSWGPKADATWRNPGFPQGDDHPVTCISWFDADAFCQWATKETGRKVRLPTEAELEYLQRAGTETRFFWGSRPDHRGIYANVANGDVNGDDDQFPDRQPIMKSRTRNGRNDGYDFTAPRWIVSSESLRRLRRRGKCLGVHTRLGRAEPGAS